MSSGKSYFLHNLCFHWLHGHNWRTVRIHTTDQFLIKKESMHCISKGSTLICNAKLCYVVVTHTLQNLLCYCSIATSVRLSSEKMIGGEYLSLFLHSFIWWTSTYKFVHWRTCSTHSRKDLYSRCRTATQTTIRSTPDGVPWARHLGGVTPKAAGARLRHCRSLTPCRITQLPPLCDQHECATPVAKMGSNSVMIATGYTTNVGHWRHTVHIINHVLSRGLWSISLPCCWCCCLCCYHSIQMQGVILVAGLQQRASRVLLLVWPYRPRDKNKEDVKD